MQVPNGVSETATGSGHRLSTADQTALPPCLPFTSSTAEPAETGRDAAKHLLQLGQAAKTATFTATESCNYVVGDQLISDVHSIVPHGIVVSTLSPALPLSAGPPPPPLFAPSPPLPTGSLPPSLPPSLPDAALASAGSSIVPGITPRLSRDTSCEYSASSRERLTQAAEPGMSSSADVAVTMMANTTHSAEMDTVSSFPGNDLPDGRAFGDTAYLGMTSGQRLLAAMQRGAAGQRSCNLPTLQQLVRHQREGPLAYRQTISDMHKRFEAAEQADRPHPLRKAASDLTHEGFAHRGSSHSGSVLQAGRGSRSSSFGQPRLGSTSLQSLLKQCGEEAGIQPMQSQLISLAAAAGADSALVTQSKQRLAREGQAGPPPGTSTLSCCKEEVQGLTNTLRQEGQAGPLPLISAATAKEEVAQEAKKITGQEGRGGPLPISEAAIGEEEEGKNSGKQEGQVGPLLHNDAVSGDTAAVSFSGPETTTAASAVAHTQQKHDSGHMNSHQHGYGVVTHKEAAQEQLDEWDLSKFGHQITTRSLLGVKLMTKTTGMGNAQNLKFKLGYNTEPIDKVKAGYDRAQQSMQSMAANMNASGQLAAASAQAAIADGNRLADRLGQRSQAALQRAKSDTAAAAAAATADVSAKAAAYAANASSVAKTLSDNAAAASADMSAKATVYADHAATAVKGFRASASDAAKGISASSKGWWAKRLEK